MSRLTLCSFPRGLEDAVAPSAVAPVAAGVPAEGRPPKTTTGPLLEVIRTAAATDSEIATLWDDIQAKLLRVQRSVVDQLDALEALRPSLETGEAADILWTLNHPSVWHPLVRGRRWSPARYERWLHESFCLQLLGTVLHR